MAPPKPTPEEITKEAFLYYNTRGKEFVIEKMVEDGIPRNTVQAEFERYKRDHYDQREEERTPFALGSYILGLVGVAIVILVVKIALRSALR